MNVLVTSRSLGKHDPAAVQQLEAAGFTIERFGDHVAESKAFAAKVTALVERGEKPPHRAIPLIHGELGAEAASNMAESSRVQALLPIEVMCIKP